MCRIAVVLNRNARSITDNVIDEVKSHISKDDKVFVSGSLDEAKSIVKDIIYEGFEVVMSGGGDGTFSQCVSDIASISPWSMPSFGMLKLGTGNALADILGIGSDMKKEFECARNANARTPMSLVKVGEFVTPFAGVGLDAMVLSDYDDIKGELDDDPLFGAMKSQRGKLDYGLAVSLRSIWKFILDIPMFNIKVTSLGNNATRIDRNGLFVGGNIGQGEEIYSGSAIIAATSTIPYYGMGFKMFPQANPNNSGFQFRVVNMRPHELIAELPKFMVSDLFHEHISDFRCDKIHIQLEKETPSQVGGNFHGEICEMIVENMMITAVLGSRKSLSEKTTYRS